MAQLTNYVDQNSYFQDMKTIDERLTNIEHILDGLTKDKVESLNNEDRLSALEGRLDRLTQSILGLLKEENIKSKKVSE